MATPKKNDATYREKYHWPGVRINAAFNPKLPHMADGSVVLEAFMMEAGRYADGREYQIVRVIVQPGA